MAGLVPPFFMCRMGDNHSACLTDREEIEWVNTCKVGLDSGTVTIAFCSTLKRVVHKGMIGSHLVALTQHQTHEHKLCKW